MGVYPEKGMMSQFGWKVLDSAVVTTQAESILVTVTVSPSPQPRNDTDEKLHALREYARDFRHRHMKDAQDFDWDLDDEDHGLAIRHLVVT
jgi:hypothetical protein